jgi:hypothetical protein
VRYQKSQLKSSLNIFLQKRENLFSLGPLFAPPSPSNKPPAQNQGENKRPRVVGKKWKLFIAM